MNQIFRLSTAIAAPIESTRTTVSQFIVAEGDKENINLVEIHGKKYPVYKDHEGYYVIINGVKCQETDFITELGTVIKYDAFKVSYKIV